VEEISEGLREVVSNTGIPVAAYADNWSTGLGMIPDHCDRGNHLRAGICLAQKVMLWRKHYPHARIVLVGFSTGAHVTLLSTFYVPPGSVDRVILLAASVSTDYDLRSALHASREGVDSFYSNQDSTLPTAVDFLGSQCPGGLCLVTQPGGTADGKRCPMAGTIGFNGGLARQLEPQLFCKLRQYGWNPAWERVHHDGDRHGYAHTDFLEAYVMPLVTGRFMCP